MSKESFLEKLKSKKTGVVVDDVTEVAKVTEKKVTEPVFPKAENAPKEGLMLSKYTVHSKDRDHILSAKDTASALLSELLDAEELTPMQIVAKITEASKSLEDAVKVFEEAASKEFDARMAEKPDAKKLIVGQAVFTKNSGSTRWTYSSAVADLQAEEKKNGKATSKVSQVSKSYKISV